MGPGRRVTAGRTCGSNDGSISTDQSVARRASSSTASMTAKPAPMHIRDPAPNGR